MMTHKELTLAELDKFMADHGTQIDNVLEVGCGSNSFKQYFQSKGKGWVGMDLTIHPDPHVLLADFNNIPYRDDTFDLVFCCHSFEHTTAPIRTLSEITRVSGKFVFMSTPYPCEHQILDGDEDHLFCLTDLQMRRLFRFCKLNRVDVYYDKKAELEQDWNLISIGKVK